MTMSATTLKTELLNLEPTSSEADAVQALTDAYGVFALEAEANAVPLTQAGVDLGKAAMSVALVGMSMTGLTIIPSAIRSFWTAVAGGVATSFPGCTAITAPPHTTLDADFQVVTEANTANKRSKDAAMEALASLLKEQAVLGGTATFAGTPFPIL